jgi:hypothetical protein
MNEAAPLRGPAGVHAEPRLLVLPVLREQEAIQVQARARLKVEAHQLTSHAEEADLAGTQRSVNRLLASPALPPSDRPRLLELSKRLADHEPMQQLQKTLQLGKALPATLEVGPLPSPVRLAFQRARGVQQIEIALHGNAAALEEIESHLLVINELLPPHAGLKVRLRLALCAVEADNLPLARKLAPPEFLTATEKGEVLRDLRKAADNVEVLVPLQHLDLGLPIPLGPIGARPALAGSPLAGLPPLESARPHVQATLRKEVNQHCQSFWADIRSSLTNPSSYHLARLVRDGLERSDRERLEERLKEQDRRQPLRGEPSPLALMVEQKLGRPLTAGERDMVPTLHRQGHQPGQIVEILRTID